MHGEIYQKLLCTTVGADYERIIVIFDITKIFSVNASAGLLRDIVRLK